MGPITALTWALEICDYTRFRSVKEAISYSGLCSAEKSSADKVMRTPISKQRNKHIQHVLVEAAKMAPRYSHELALVREKDMQKGNKNRATLAVARKMVAYMLAVERRKQDFVPAAKLAAKPIATTGNAPIDGVETCFGVCFFEGNTNFLAFDFIFALT